MAQARNIGIEVTPPQRACQDPHCPFHGTLPVRGQVIEGQLISTRMERSAVVQREYRRHESKYERFEKRTSKYTVHLPPCLDAAVGDHVKIMECRPLSKTKHFVVVEAKRGALRIAGMEAAPLERATPPAAEAGEEAGGTEEGEAE